MDTLWKPVSHVLYLIQVYTMSFQFCTKQTSVTTRISWFSLISLIYIPHSSITTHLSDKELITSFMELHDEDLNLFTYACPTMNPKWILSRKVNSPFQSSCFLNQFSLTLPNHSFHHHLKDPCCNCCLHKAAVGPTTDMRTPWDKLHLRMMQPPLHIRAIPP